MLSPQRTLPAAYLLIISILAFAVIQSDRGNFQSTYDKHYGSAPMAQTVK